MALFCKYTVQYRRIKLVEKNVRFSTNYKPDIILIHGSLIPPQNTANVYYGLEHILVSTSYVQDTDISKNIELYDFLRKAFKDTPCKIIARQSENTPEFYNYSQSVDFNVIMAHRGDSNCLKRSLDNLLDIVHSNKILLGIDGIPSKSLKEWLLDRKIRFYYTNLSYPVGPYFIRQKLIEHSIATYVIFHDSDDLSTLDRFDQLLQEIGSNQTDVLGSSILVLDDLKKDIYLRSFPNNATKSLRSGPGHCQLHPTVVSKRKNYLDEFGFSSDMVFGLDTQQLLRSATEKQHTNINRILYLKNNRIGALTTSKETHLDSELRQKLLKDWKSEYLSSIAGQKNDFNKLARQNHKDFHHVELINDSQQCI